MGKKYPIYVKIFIGLLVGLIAGLLCNLILPGNSTVQWIAGNIANPMGQVFLRMIFMIIVPLIFTAIVLGVADFKDINKIGKIGGRVLLYTFIITSISVIIGMVLVNIFQPGIGISPENRAVLSQAINTNNDVNKIVTTARESKTLIQILLDIIPRNPLADAVNYTNPTYTGGGLIAVMFFSLIFGMGLAVNYGNKRVEVLTRFLEGLYDVLMKVIDFAMLLAPYAVAGLIFTTVSQLGFTFIIILFKYIAIVLSALLIHFIFTYGTIIKFIIKRNPLEFFRNISDVLLTAFSTSSSNATLPYSIKASIEKLKINKDVSNFVLTIGSTANQNGTALYEGITVLFLAQFYGIDLSFAQQLTVVLLSVLAGIGTAGVPGGSLPLIVMVLTTVGIPAEGIGIILGVDRILDMSRTVVNVSGDIVLAAWVDKSPEVAADISS